MKSFSKWFSAVAAIALLAGTATAADIVSAGKVKATNPDNKSFVLTDAAGKDHTILFGDRTVVNRGGKMTKSELSAGDTVNISHDNAGVKWTARYILVQEGDTKNCALVHGAVKNYDAATKQLSFTDDNSKNWMVSTGDAGGRPSGLTTRIEDLKSGDHAVIVVETSGATTALRDVMVDRK